MFKGIGISNSLSIKSLFFGIMILLKFSQALMVAQKDLVAIIATFSPKIVRMADDGSRED